jgi:DNA-binding IclR family transcriptional regulator
MEWTDYAKPELRRLSDEVGETCHLAVLDDGMVLYVDKAESSRSLRMPSQVGRRLHAHCTALGKVLLAYLSSEQLDRVIEQHGLPRMTSHTITDPVALRVELAQIREHGFSMDDEELEDGLRCIAAPIRRYDGTVIASLSLAGPMQRIPNELVPRYRDLLMGAAAGVSQSLGLHLDVRLADMRKSQADVVDTGRADGAVPVIAATNDR